MASLHLAAWIVARQPGVTHLKLQKLVFYCFGYALGHDEPSLALDLGEARFSAWKHGPVEVTVYKAYAKHKATPITEGVGDVPRFGPTTEALLTDVLDVYGRLSAWQLREETHLEAPWRESFQRLEGSSIPTASIRTHFVRKSAIGRVHAPVHLVHGASAELDGVAPATYRSLRELAQAVRMYA